MTLPKVLQTALGLIFLFYIVKGLLGKFSDGELTKAIVALLAWLALVGFNSGLMNAKPLNVGKSKAVNVFASTCSRIDAEA
jgi:membrane-associated protease RseP (regulator of RpoE activity)